jgi:aspartate carbamoyltransferase catalytic subunit
MPVRNLIGFDDVSVEWWDGLYRSCTEIMARPDDYRDACRGKLLASLFFESSTRTRFSFQAAMLRLGGSLFGFSNPADTSISKGESLADTIRMTSSYADAIVMRTTQEGAALAASLYSAVPVINAGDGGHLHPTQTLTDLTTIAQTRGAIGNVTVGLCGDLKYGRTVHSLVTALAKFPKVRFVLIAPDALKMPEYMTAFMRAHLMEYTVADSLESALGEIDVLYMTRIQRERFDGAEMDIDAVMTRFTLTAELMRRAKADLTVLHPLPRVNEIERAVDADPRAKYFDQARLGMFIRMALLLDFTHQPRGIEYPAREGGNECGNPKCVTKTELYLPKRLNADGGCGYCDKRL